MIEEDRADEEALQRLRGVLDARVYLQAERSFNENRYSDKLMRVLHLSSGGRVLGYAQKIILWHYSNLSKIVLEPLLLFPSEGESS